MTDETHNIIIDILRRLQADSAEVKTSLRDLKAGIISVKQQLHTM